MLRTTLGGVKGARSFGKMPARQNSAVTKNTDWISGADNVAEELEGPNCSDKKVKIIYVGGTAGMKVAPHQPILRAQRLPPPPYTS